VLDTKSPKYLEMAQGHISLSVPSTAAGGLLHADQISNEQEEGGQASDQTVSRGG
jgi:hypothetical protein